MSSLAHWAGSIDFDDPNYERRRYLAMPAYGQSKLANLLFTRELHRRLTKNGHPALAVAAHPGSTRTNLQQHSGVMAGFMAMWHQEPSDGALPTLHAATAEGVRGGAYFGPQSTFGVFGAPGPARVKPVVQDRAAAERLWDLSERLTGITFQF